MKVDAFDRLDLQLLHALQVNGRAGTVDPHLLGETQWYVRARATPDAALPVAQAMAHRADTSWVRLISGDTEIVLRSPSPFVGRDRRPPA